MWDEVKREFAWQALSKQKKKNKPESLYSKMTRGVKEWFQDEELPIAPDLNPHHCERINQEYRQEQKKLGLH